MSSKKKLVSTIEHHLKATDGRLDFLGDCYFDDTSWELFLKNLRNFEPPDGYSIIDDTLYIVEHFEFDSTEFSEKKTKTKKKGSETRAEDSRIEREFHKAISAATTMEGLFKDSYNVCHSSQNYVANAARNITTHYNKIDSYIENLRTASILNDGQIVRTGFFIEDTTVFGNIYIKRDKENPYAQQVPIILCQTKQFLDLFSTYTKLDFCFCANNYGSNYFLSFINRESIPEYRKIEIDMEKIEILNLSPQAGGVYTVIDSTP